MSAVSGLFSLPFSSCAARHSRSSVRARSHQSPPSRYELCSFPDIVCGRDSRREVTPALAESKSSCREQIPLFLSAKHFALSRRWEVVTKLFMHGPRSEIFVGSDFVYLRFFCREQITTFLSAKCFALSRIWEVAKLCTPQSIHLQPDHGHDHPQLQPPARPSPTMYPQPTTTTTIHDRVCLRS